jgi:23S rRNA (guanine745-N1)-methyltransferase
MVPATTSQCSFRKDRRNTGVSWRTDEAACIEVAETFMQIAEVTNLACPIDGLPIHAHATQRRCAAGHSFDIARAGYCNLLVVQHKASRDPGDSKDMVAARRRFLEAGHFQPVADHVFNAVGECLTAAEDGALNVIDAGCGEGYYLHHLARLAAASAEPGTLGLAGIDVSKWAVKAAARRKAPVTWLVANNRTPPFLAGSSDMVLCLFGFPAWEGFKKIQKPGGHVLLVDPAADHLLELREIIYPSVRRSPAPPLEGADAAGYRLQREDGLRFSVTLTDAHVIQDLVAMTPHAHRMAQAGKEALAGQRTLSVTVDVAVRLLALERA